MIDSGFTKFSLDIIGLKPEHIFHNERGDVVTLAEELIKYKLDRFVFIKDFVSKELLYQIFKEYSFLVSTSLSETFGLGVAEAIMNGLPVVCTDSGGIHEFVNESNGILVQIRNPERLANAIKGMFNKRHLYISSNISETIINEFGTKAFRIKLVNIYNDCLNSI